MLALDDELPWPSAGGPLLGRYELLGVIGRGGMGVVSRARDLRTGRHVAIKRIRGADERAEREALAAARLKHPSIVELIDAEPTDDGWILVSEFVDGADLRAVLRAGALTERDIARFAGSICLGLAHAHAHGVVHRDVKPANILCPADPRSAGAWAKLTDFGVAALADAETLTAAGDVVGTMAYMAPEQARGHRAEAPADVFALALVVFEALAGLNPRRGSTAAETAARATGSMPPLARWRPDLPAAVHGAIDACLEVDPGHRGDLGELQEGLRRLASLADEPQRGHTAVTRFGRRGETVVDARRAPLPPADPGRMPHDGHPEPVYAHPRATEPEAAGWAGTALHSPQRTPQREPRPAPPAERSVAPAPRGRMPRLPARLAGAAGAAAAIAVTADAAGAPPALAALGLAALLLPRLTWFAVAATIAGLLAGRDETAAALAAIAAIAPLALLGGRGTLWPAGGLAAGLALIGAPAAWPALAALAPGGALRVGLALQGSLVAAATATAVSVPLLNVPAGDFVAVLTEFTAPLAAIWGGSALVLGVILRGRTFGADFLAACFWTGLVGGLMSGAGLAEPEPLLWAGPGVAALVVCLLRAALREQYRPPDPGYAAP